MRRERVWIYLCGLLMVAATACAYYNGLRSAFLFDDADSIANNPSIHHLGWEIFNPPHGGITASGRPLFNASLALNWAWTGNAPWSYHVVNLAGHILAGLLLFGVARRTLRQTKFAPLDALGLGGAIALLWLLHPLQTEAVTYTVQRSEMMMGLFYLAVLYALLRAAAIQAVSMRRAAAWGVAGWLACFAGMMSKEVMVSAPITVILYDRAFLAGSFREGWRRRKYYWLALATTWLPLAWEVWANRDRGGTSGLDVGVTPIQYWETQGPAICHYLRLAFWPHPLVLDYSFQIQWLQHPLDALPANALVWILAIGAIWLLVRAPKWGTLAFLFFAVLAPTSLVPGNRQSLAEHRMYLALAPLITAAVIGLWRLAARRTLLTCASVVLISAAFGGAVWARNAQYDDPESMWRENLAYTPDNQFALCNLGAVYYGQGRLAKAQEIFAHAAAVAPNYSAAESNLGVVLVAEHKPAEALPHLRRALELSDTYEVENNMGVALASLHRWDEAISWYHRALARRPDSPDALRNLAEARDGEAQQHFDAGDALVRAGRRREAIGEYEEALRWHSNLAGAYANMGTAWLALGDTGRAVAALATSIQLAPRSALCHYNYALALKADGKLADAEQQDRAAVELAPGLAPATNNLAAVVEQEGRPAEALALLRRFLDAHPDSSEVRRSLNGILRAHPELR